MRLVNPLTPVTVRRDGRWYGGQLRAWRQDHHGWLADVLYAVAPGLRYLEWVPAERVREAHRTCIARNDESGSERGV
jgi:hypothetical protein